MFNMFLVNNLCIDIIQAGGCPFCNVPCVTLNHTLIQVFKVKWSVLVLFLLCYYAAPSSFSFSCQSNNNNTIQIMQKYKIWLIVSLNAKLKVILICWSFFFTDQETAHKIEQQRCKYRDAALSLTASLKAVICPSVSGHAVSGTMRLNWLSTGSLLFSLSMSGTSMPTNRAHFEVYAVEVGTISNTTACALSF